MDTVTSKKREGRKENEVGGIDSYRESIKKALYSAVGNALDKETQLATIEMTEEREKAIKQLAGVEMAVIHKILEEGKRAIWVKADEAKQSENFSVEAIRKVISQAYMFPQSIENNRNPR
jgi:precorrin-2 methylase